jgi:nicotinamidase/pyrazinamidase
MRALILVDLQNDFIPGGALPVPDGDKVLPVANALMPKFQLVVASQDWHPQNHGSFAANHPDKKPGDVIDLNGLQQTLWPTHCVQNTPGAALLSGLFTRRINRIFQKGTDPAIDSYSAFYDNGHKNSTGLAPYLKSKQVNEVVIMGLASDYCVKYTALDARNQGLAVTLVRDGCRGVDLKENDIAEAFSEMQRAGVKMLNSHEIK